MDLTYLIYICAGAFVGIAVGITGVGGGSLMTPLLLLFGFPPNVAIGTDLLYAAITKSSGIVAHHKNNNIDWRLVKRMALGSVPAAIITSILLKLFFNDASEYSHILTLALGIMLVLTSFVLFFRQRLKEQAFDNRGIIGIAHQHPVHFTIIMGFIIGVFVTLSSVGAGAIGAAVLMTLYPHLSSHRVVGVDIAHAVPLTFIAGFAHLWLGNVNFMLLACLLIGSLPAVHLGAQLGKRIPSRILQPVLASILMGLGLKFVFF
ncbi:MAG: sulfite exporter TauE/SafE family protein [Pseudomonadota bacterium]